MRKCRRKRNVDITNEEVKESISEVEESKIRKCSRKSHVDIINEEMEGSSSEEKILEYVSVGEEFELIL